MLFAIVLAAAAPDKLQFNRDVRPILSDACFACHGPDKAKRKGGLRLDVRDAAVEKGAIVPGKPAESELVARLKLPANDEQHMPPAHAHKELTAKQLATLETWITQGAEYQPYWAYMPAVKAPVPATKTKSETPIDAFLIAELEKRNLSFSPEADRRTLIRRLSLDLIGLPPTPEEVTAFVNDHSQNAYENLVDRLLASPHFGERMATPWLDLVRFADTVGYHGDQNQRIFPYRDYVIEAFNANMPFDQFTREQLAGDLLPNPTPKQLTATGFNRLNMMTREGGAQPKEYYAKYQADRVRTVSMAWLGSTMGCAECHDHKYDPFTAKDFYALSAFFADVRQWGVYSDYAYTPNPDLKGWTNDHPFPPEIEVESTYLKQRAEGLRADLRRVARVASAAFDSDEKKRADFESWKKSSLAFLAKNPTGWQTLKPADVTNAVIEGRDRVVMTGPAKKGSQYELTYRPGAGWLNAIKVEVLPHERNNGKLTRDGAANTTVKIEVNVRWKVGAISVEPILFAEADRSDVIRYSNTAPVLGVADGWRTASRYPTQTHTAVYLTEQPARLSDDETLTVIIKSDNVGSVRVSHSPFACEDLKNPGIASVFQQRVSVVPGPQASGQEALQEAYLLGTMWDFEAFKKSVAIRKELFALNHGKAWTQVTVAQAPTTTRVLPRGNWMDESGQIVEPAVPEFLGGPKPAPGKRLTRLDLANWIAAKDNPLTARVFVNRLWKQFFGTPLSANPEDVGGQGEPPSHPELLDYLAVEFAADWDVKKAVKRVVMTAAYRQQSKGRPEVREFDPGNRLLSFHPPRRLEAEFVRDNALAVSGLLNRDVGGPSSKPYQPDGYYANLQFPDRKYAAATDRTQYRRGLYTHWQRTFLHPMLANFDAPSREECTAYRPTANTPQQALTLLNDPTFVEAARVLAADAMKASGDDKRLSLIFQRVLAREPVAAERAALLKFLASQTEHFAANPPDAAKLLKVGIAPAPANLPPAELAAWTGVCRAVLNLHETITRY